MKNIQRTIELILFSLILVCCRVKASEKSITVVTEYVAPFQIQNEDGSLGGYSVDVVKRLFELTNLTPKIHIFPWARAYRLALNEPNVLIFSMARSPGRELLFNWIGALQTERHYFWGLKTQFKEKFNALDQAKKYRISVSRDYYSAQHLQDLNFPYQFYTTRDLQNVGMLMKGRADLIVSTETVLRGISKEHNYSFSAFQKLIEIKALNNKLSIAFNKDSDKKLVSRFKVAFKSLKDTGELRKIQLKWGIDTN